MKLFARGSLSPNLLNPDLDPLPSLETAGSRIGMPKAGKKHFQKPCGFFLYISSSPGMDPSKDEDAEFLSDLRISKPTRRIPKKNRSLFWQPEPRFCRRHGIAWDFYASLAIFDIFSIVVFYGRSARMPSPAFLKTERRIPNSCPTSMMRMPRSRYFFASAS